MRARWSLNLDWGLPLLQLDSDLKQKAGPQTAVFKWHPCCGLNRSAAPLLSATLLLRWSRCACRAAGSCDPGAALLLWSSGRWSARGPPSCQAFAAPWYNRRHPKFLEKENFLLNGYKRPLGLKGLRELLFSLKAGRVSITGELTFAAPFTPQSHLSLNSVCWDDIGRQPPDGPDLSAFIPGFLVTLLDRCWKDKPQLLAIVIS